MSIVSLAWGSLIWDPRELPVSSDWLHDGPELPIEFARQSNDGRITLVVTPRATPVRVYSAALGVAHIDEARQSLAVREGISDKNMRRSIGYWTADAGSDHPETEAIGRWAQDSRYTGVVWTALKPKFGDRFVTPTSNQVVSYLEGLTGEAAMKAETYIRRTPQEIQTVYRANIEATLGWTPLLNE